MRRIVVTVCGTCAGVGLLMAWPTSLDRAAPGFVLEALGSAKPIGPVPSNASATPADSTATPTPVEPSDTPQTPTPTPTPTTAPDVTAPPSVAPSAVPGAPGTAVATPATTAPAPVVPPAPAAAPLTSATVTGVAVATPYGAVQVRITVTNHHLAASQAIAYPNLDGRSMQISSYAVPILDQEAVAAGSAQISMVGGATFTSTGYIRSLQDALDQASR